MGKDAFDRPERDHDERECGTGGVTTVRLAPDMASDPGIPDRLPVQIGLRLQDRQRGRVTIGYWVASQHRRRGVATEALRIISSWGATLAGVYRLDLCIEPSNEGSRRAAERVGYQNEGLLRSWEWVGGERKDTLMYSPVRPSPPGTGHR